MKMHFTLLTVAVTLSGCYSQAQVASHWLKKSANKASGNCTSEGYLKVGNPYYIFGIKYFPKKTSHNYDETGIASWYGTDFHGKPTANGECYDMYAMTAAHKTLPLPTTVRVTNLKNGRSVVLKVNDRGPYADNRIIDLSYAAAKKLDMARDGIQKVRVQAIGGPHHHPNGASKETIQASRNAAPAQRKKITREIAAQNARHSLTRPQAPVVTQTMSASTAPAIPAQTAQVTIANQPVNARVTNTNNTSSFTNRISNPAPTTPVPQPAPAQTAQPTQQPIVAPATALSVQFGSYSQHANAMVTWQNTTQTFPNATLQTQSINGTPIHRIRTGPFKNQADAAAALEKARQAGFNNAVIVLE